MVDIWQQNLHKWPNTYIRHLWHNFWRSQDIHWNTLHPFLRRGKSTLIITESFETSKELSTVLCLQLQNILQKCSAELFYRTKTEIYGEFDRPKITYLFLLEKNSPVVFALYSVSFSCPLFDGRWYKQYDHLSVVTWSDL